MLQRCALRDGLSSLLVHTIYYRVLGIQVGAQPLTYLTFSGNYLVSILLSAPQLATVRLYFPNLAESGRALLFAYLA